MTKIIDYYYSQISPWTYLGHDRLRALAAKYGAQVNYKPVNHGEVFPRTGGLPLPKRSPERQAYRLVELARWRDHLGIPLNLKPRHFPVPEWPAAGMVIAAGGRGLDAGALSGAFFRAVWAEERDISDRDTLVAIAEECGHDGAALLEEGESAATRALYDAQTEEAIARGVFGAPTYFYRDEQFWGQDRLEFLERALARDS
ncbi:MAG: 2-hydroxychromene-2-carboxylate isomerase [Hyphomicrobiales bacterium]|nr:2-hydroxychromene-2-carboxylate isomerase [Hyphomicrobiales bacterium]